MTARVGPREPVPGPSRPLRRRPLAILVLVLTLAACAAEPEPVAPEVVVGGAPGTMPELEYRTPLAVTERTVEVISEGTGPELVDGEPILVDYYAESGADGSLIGETYSRHPQAYVLSAEALGPDIHAALEGQRVGSRILELVPPGGGQDFPTVAVFDILPTRATGEEVPAREGLPTVTLADDGEPTITVPATEPPSEMVVQPLIKGNGPQVEAGQVVTVQYTGVRWSDGTVFDSTWGPAGLPAPFPVGGGSMIEGWDTGLIEQTVGSQVLLVVPPGLGYGGTDSELSGETLVLVVDILAADGAPTGE